MDAQVGQLLQAALDPNLQSQAAAALKEIQDQSNFETQRNFILALFKHVRENPDGGVRQMGAVTLKRQLEKNWNCLTDQDKTDLWNKLFQHFTNESDTITRRSLTHLVATVAKHRLEEGAEGVVEFIAQSFCTPQSSPDAKAVAFTIFGEVGASSKPPNSDIIISCLKNGVADESSVVICSALESMTKIAELGLEHGALEFVRELVPAVLTRVRSSNNDEDIMSAAMTAMCALASEMPDVFGEEAALETVPVVIECVGLNENLPIGVREQAFEILHELTHRLPRTFSNKPYLLQGLLRGVIQMASQPENTEEEEEGSTPFLVACNTVDSLALNLQPQVFLQHMLDLLAPLIRSSNIWERRAALTFLGLMSEGCSEWLRGRVGELVGYALDALADPEPLIRQTGGLHLGQMAEYLQPEVLRYAPQAFQACARALADNPNEEVICKLCYALEVFCKYVNSTVMGEFQAQLFPQLMQTLTQVKDEMTKGAILDVLSAMADSAKEHFAVHRNVAADLVQSIFREKQETLKCSAIRLAGKIVSGMTTDDTGLRESLVKLALNELVQEEESEDSAQIRSVCFGFFEQLAHAAKNQMAPLLIPVMSAAFAAAFSSDVAPTEDADLDDDLDCVQVHATALDQLTTAIDCLTAVFAALSPELTLPYGSKTLEVIMLLYNHYHADVRVAIGRLGQTFLMTTHLSSRPSWWQPRSDPTYLYEESCWRPSVRRPWTPGFPTQCQLSVSVRKLWLDHLWPCMAAVLCNDSESGVIRELAHQLAEILLILGPGLLCDDQGALIDDYANLIINTVGAVLETQHPCLTNSDVSLDDDGRAKEELLFEGISTLLGAVAEVVGATLAVPVFERFQPIILRLVNHKGSAVYRCNGLGCYADMLMSVSEMRPAGYEQLLSRYVAAVAPVLADGISQKTSFTLRQNSTFVAGIIAQVAPTDPVTADLVGPCYRAACDVIASYLLEPPMAGEMAALDNTVAMLARFLLYLPPTLISDTDSTVLNKCRLAQVLVSHLPLKEDAPESQVCAKAYIRLVQESNPAICKEGYLLMAEGGVLMVSDPRTISVLAKSQGVSSDERTLLEDLEEAVKVLLSTGNIQSLLASPKIANVDSAKVWLEKLF